MVEIPTEPNKGKLLGVMLIMMLMMMMIMMMMMLMIMMMMTMMIKMMTSDYDRESRKSILPDPAR